MNPVMTPIFLGCAILATAHLIASAKPEGPASPGRSGRLLAQFSPGPLPQGALPASRRPDGKAHGLTPEIETFLRKVIQNYATAESYRDHGRVRLVQQSGRVK